MPEITDITAMSVVVARMMPSSVRKLRSLLELSDCKAPRRASQKDAWLLISNPAVQNLDGAAAQFISSPHCQNPLYNCFVQPEAGWPARDEPNVAAVFGSKEFDVRDYSVRLPIGTTRRGRSVSSLD